MALENLAIFTVKLPCMILSLGWDLDVQIIFAGLNICKLLSDRAIPRNSAQLMHAPVFSWEDPSNF